MNVYIIAEAGVNHNGDLGRALAMVDEAAKAGADAIKFQSFHAESLVTASARKAEYQEKNTGSSGGQLEMLKALELDEDAHRKLMARCEERGIEFLSTPFDLESALMLKRLGVRRMKIPSGEITNLPLLRLLGSFSLPMILSTGMSTLNEVRDAVEALTATGLDQRSICVLQCTTEYPAPFEEVNLKAMLTMRMAMGVAVGFSDHTPGMEASVAAAALGAEIIEKHFTLDKALPGPDHKASLDPKELASLVSAIRNVELSMGSGAKRPGPSELRNIQIARKSIVASRGIKKGEAFTADNLASKRPGTGLSPMHWDSVVGQKAKRDFIKDEAIEL